MNKDHAATTMTLPSTLDELAARAFLMEMNALPRDRAINLDAANVTTLSPGYLQILASAFKSFSTIGVIDPTVPMLEAFSACQIVLPPAIECGNKTKREHVIRDEASVAVERVAPVLSAPEATAAQPKTILTIDDSRTMRDMLKMTLGNAGFSVVQAVDGEDGLNALANQPVDLIITDINMPKLDGYGVVRAVRSNPSYQNTPILMLSTEDEEASKDMAKDAGATGYVVKPFDPDGLVSLVNKVCV
jgi:two-component system chemotaxis response regulator CheY